MTAPLARAAGGQPVPGRAAQPGGRGQRVRGARAAARGAGQEILAAQRPVLEAAGFRVGREIGELSVNPGTRSFAGGAGRRALDQLRGRSRWRSPLGPCAAGSAATTLAITWATLTPEGIRLRYHGDARDGDRDVAGVLVREITEDIAELSIADDAGRTYRVPAANVPRRHLRAGALASGETRMDLPKGSSLAEAVRGEAGSRGRPPRRPVARAWAGTARPFGSRFRRRRGAYGYRPAALADPGGMLPGPARTAGSRLVDRLLRDWHGGTRHRGHRGRGRRRAGRRRRAAAGQPRCSRGSRTGCGGTGTWR